MTRIRARPEACVGNELSHFGHLASLVWAKLILGRLVMRHYPIFLNFLLVPTITLTRLSLIPDCNPRHGRYYEDMSQGLRICVRVFCLRYR